MAETRIGIASSERLALQMDFTRQLMESGDPNDIGYRAWVIRAADAFVNQYAATRTIAPTQVLILKADFLFAAGESITRAKDFKRGACIQEAATDMISAAAIRREQRMILEGFGLVPSDGKRIKVEGDELLPVLAAFRGLSGTLGVSAAQNAYFLYELGHTVEATPEFVRLQAAAGIPEEEADKADDYGTYSVRVRKHMLPWHVVFQRAESEAEQDLLQHVVHLNRVGIERALLAIIYERKGHFITSSRGYAKAIKSLPNYFYGAPLRYHLTPQQEADLRSIGAMTREYLEVAEIDPTLVPWEKYPEVTRIAANIHDLWVFDNMRQAAKNPARHLVAFQDQRAIDKVSNLLSLAVAIDSVIKANAAVQDILSRGILNAHGRLTDYGFLLQVNLVNSAHQALAAHTLDERNEIHARAIADEAALLTAHALGISDMSIVASIHVVYYNMIFDAGQEFYKEGGGGSSAAGRVAVTYLGELWKAIEPETTQSVSDLQARAMDILARATIDDVARLMAMQFGRQRVPETGDDLREKFRQICISQSDWFTDEIDTLPVSPHGKGNLTHEAIIWLATFLRAANATWKSGQVFRAQEDASRVNPHRRHSVYNPWEAIITPVDDHAATLTIVKDLYELQKAVKAIRLFDTP